MPTEEVFVVTFKISNPLLEAIQVAEVALKRFKQEPTPENEAGFRREYEAAWALANHPPHGVELCHSPT